MEDNGLALAICGDSDELQRGRMQGDGVMRIDDGQPGHAGETDSPFVRDARGGDASEGGTPDPLEDDGRGVFRAIAVIVAAEFVSGFCIWLAFQ